MKPFSIIITGASRPELWYADKVGQAFEVSSCDTSEDAEPLFYVRYFEAGVPDWVDWSVMWDDCELAPQPEAAEPKPTAREQTHELASVLVSEFQDIIKTDSIVVTDIGEATVYTLRELRKQAAELARKLDEAQIEFTNAGANGLARALLNDDGRGVMSGECGKAQAMVRQLRRVAEAAETYRLGGFREYNELVAALAAWKASAK